MPIGPQILQEIDVAAGGLLIRQGTGQQELCVVLRHRYGDWVLPKGHPDGDETLSEAALREVLEETGCHARIEHMVAPMSYLVGTTPKLVVFYAMAPLSYGDRRDKDEVSEVRWLGPEQACARLSYENERRLVADVLGGASH